MTTVPTYDKVVFLKKGPLGIETPTYIKYVEDGQGGSREIDVTPLPDRREVNEQTGYYAGSSKPFLEDFISKNFTAADAIADISGAASLLGRPLWQSILDRGSKESWTDIPGAGRRRRGTADLLNRSRFKMIPPNPLRQLPHPAMRNFIGEGIVPYFEQHGPRPYGSGSI